MELFVNSRVTRFRAEWRTCRRERFRTKASEVDYTFGMHPASPVPSPGELCETGPGPTTEPPTIAEQTVLRRFGGGSPSGCANQNVFESVLNRTHQV